ncbi:MAG: phosphoribosylanthranilate isomerase [Steroidobacteraceae bacterium]
MTTFVKICGITTEEAVEAAVAAGADAIGFVFHAPSPRDIEPQRAALLARHLPRGASCVAVTRHPDQRLVDRILEAFMPHAWQSDAEDFASLRIPAGIERWPVLRGLPPAPQGPQRILFDSAQSGSGELANWGAAAVLARTCELILGGGLDVASVGRAIAAVRPFGVDVSSGVERAPGIKDARRIREFIVAARLARQAIRA